MTPNRVLDFSAWVRGQLIGMRPAALMELERLLEIEPTEADVYLREQVRARMRGILSCEEALLIRGALGRDGWVPGTKLELKVTIAALMESLCESHPMSDRADVGQQAQLQGARNSLLCGMGR